MAKAPSCWPYNLTDGRTTVFATDGLWRWRLRQASDAAGRERFWPTFLEWLNRDREPAFYFEHPPVHAEMNAEITLRLVGAKTKKIEVNATLASEKIPVVEVPGTEGDTARHFRWRPRTAGLWQIEARDHDQNVARAWITVDEPPPEHGELPPSAPQEDLLRSLAAETSGALLGDAPASWNQKLRPPQLLSEQREPLWHRAWILAVLLLLCGTELILRRRWQLL